MWLPGGELVEGAGGCCIIQVRGDCLVPAGGLGGRRKSLDSRYILKAEPLRFADKLDVREKEKSRMTPRCLV